MNTRTLLAGAALAGSLSASMMADVLEVDLGRFKFVGETSDYVYEGDWGYLLGTDVEGDTYAKTVATVDLGGLVAAMGGRQIAWIRVEDTNENWYGAASPGSDVDLFAVAGLPAEAIVTYEYDGPNSMYESWTSGDLATHVARVDHEPYSGNQTPWWVSLDRNGSLTMSFSNWPGTEDEDPADDGGDPGDGGDDGGVIDAPGDLETAVWIPPSRDEGDGDGGMVEPSWSFTDLQLRFNEISPTAEWSRIKVGFAESNFGAPVPGPAAIGVLAFSCRLRRRRR